MDLQIVPIVGLSGLNLWGDYINAVADYLDDGSCNIMYGIEPVRLRLAPKNREEIHFSIVDEFDSHDIYSNAILPERDFINSIVEAAEHFWGTMEEVTPSHPCIDFWKKEINNIKGKIRDKY